MTKDDKRRLRVFIRVDRTPVRVDVEFPDEHEDLARHYRQSVEESKKILPGKPLTVRMELSSSAVDLEMSRSLGAIVVHFDNSNNAKKWTDDICRPVDNQAHQVYFKQYWSDEDFVQLRTTLEEKWNLKTQKEVVPDRRGKEPACAQPSRDLADSSSD